MLDVAPVDPVSFTYDTSLPHAGAKVSIRAQILPGRSLDWFYLLWRQAPDHMGKLKFPLIVRVLFNLPEDRRTVLATLEAVRIHITDPRPYTRSVDEVHSDILHDNISDFIERLDKAQQQLAESERCKIVAGRMLNDAPPQRIRLKYLVWDLRSAIRLHGVRELQKKRDQCSLPLSVGERVRLLCGDGQPGRDHRRWLTTIDASLPPAFCTILSASHAFDKGDTPLT